MLKFFRKHARGWFMLAVIAIIIIVFVLYFGSQRGGQTASVIAIIDGRTISTAEFHAEYERLLDMVKKRYGSDLTSEKLKEMNLKQKAYDDLINQHIIISKAHDLKVQISDEELRDMIMSMPALQTNGMFDEYKYRQMLRYNKATAEDYETLQKISLMANRIALIIREGIKVSEKEIYYLYVLQNQKLNLQFVQISGKDVRQKINPTTAALEDYLNHNSSAFRRSEQVKIKYFYFSANAYAPGSISDAEVRDYYSLHKSNFRGKGDKQLSFAEAKNAIVKELKMYRGSRKAHDAAKNARDVIYQENNFDGYAKENNLTIHNAGYFFVDNPPKIFSSLKGFVMELVELRKGDLSRIFNGENGYYLMEVVDKKPSFVPKLGEIKNEVRKHFISSEENRLAAQEARLILDKIKAGEPLHKVASEKGLKLQETGFFRPGDSIPKLDFNQGDTETLYQLSVANPYPENPLFINNSYVVVKLKGLSKINLKDFEEKKELYKKILLSLKQEEAMRSWLAGNKEELIRGKRLSIKKHVEDL